MISTASSAIVRDVIQRNSVLANSYSLVYNLHFIEAVKPEEIARNEEVPKSELYSAGVPRSG